MKCVCLRLLRRVVGVALILALVLSLIAAVFPTEWLKDRLAARLAAATGRPVSLAGVRLGLRGIWLRGLEVGQADASLGPWLRIEQVGIALDLAELVRGRVEPSWVEVDGLALRLHRRGDGTFELADLFAARGQPAAASPSAADQDRGEPAPLTISLRNARIQVVDEPSNTRLEATDLAGRAVWRKELVEVPELRGQLNGGRVGVAGRLDRGGPVPAFEGQVRMKGVGLDVGLAALGYLVPVLAGAPASLDSRVTLALDLQGRGTTTDEVKRTLVGDGSVTLDGVALDDSRLVAALAARIPLPRTGKVGSFQSRFRVGQQRIVTDAMRLEVAGVPIHFAGWTDFDGRLDYRVRTEVAALARRLPREARSWVAELPVDLNQLGVLHLQGTLDRLVVTADGTRFLGADPARRAAELQRLRELGNRFRDRLLR